MKKTLLILAIMMASTISAEAENYYNRYGPVSIQTFYDELSPYGEWINTAVYGFAWRPYLDVNEDFRPYATRGNWAYTDLGWTWVSDYRWGWATFHYGRWYFDDYLGWMWVPGNEWAPAWVTWGTYDDCWAWAPMGPNIQVNVSFYGNVPAFWWTFVPRSHFCSVNWHSFVYNHPVHVTHITYITNVYYDRHNRHRNGNWFYGPRVRDVEKHAHAHVRKMQMVDTDKPGNVNARNNRLFVYRPAVSGDQGNVVPGSARSTDKPRNSARPEQINPQPARIAANRTSETANPVRTTPAERSGANSTRPAPRISTVPEKSSVTRQQPVKTRSVSPAAKTNSTGAIGNAGKSATGNAPVRGQATIKTATRSGADRSAETSNPRNR